MVEEDNGADPTSKPANVLIVYLSRTVKELCSRSKVLEGFEMKGGIERDGILLAIKDEKAREAESKVKKWLQKLTII